MKMPTAPPFSTDTREWVAQVFDEMFRVLKPGARLAIYCADWQAEPLRVQGKTLPSRPLLDVPIDRKGSLCHIWADKPLSTLPAFCSRSSATADRAVRPTSASSATPSSAASAGRRCTHLH
jgi:hypothetical protein